MTIGSRVNPNFPIPGVDQSSRGFRDNFATIKEEIENLQSKHIQLTGAFISDPVQVGDGQRDVVIPVLVNLANVQAAGSNLSVQYNLNNRIAGSTVYFNNERLGINTNSPRSALDVSGNARIESPMPVTRLHIGDAFVINASPSTVTFAVSSANAVVIDNTNLSIGIGTAPRARLNVLSNANALAIFHGTRNNSDSGIRLTTAEPNATMGLVLEQRSTNKVGGLRMDQNGNVSIHANENMDANLSDASRVINILPNNNVGIGSMVPQNRLDVSGNTHVRGRLVVTGNISVANTNAISGIFFSDGSYQTTAATGNGGARGMNGPVEVVAGTSVDLSLANYHKKTITENTNFTFDNTPEPGVLFFMEITNGGAHTVNWPVTTRWSNGVAPTLTTLGTDILSFMTVDSGMSWHGTLISRDST